MGRYTQRRKAEFQAREIARNKPSLKKAIAVTPCEPGDMRLTALRFMRQLRRAWLISVLMLRPLSSFGDQGEFRNVTLLYLLI